MSFMPNPQILHLKVTPPTCLQCGHLMTGHLFQTEGVKVITLCKSCNGLCVPSRTVEPSPPKILQVISQRGIIAANCRACGHQMNGHVFHVDTIRGRVIRSCKVCQGPCRKADSLPSKISLDSESASISDADKEKYK